MKIDHLAVLTICDFEMFYSSANCLVSNDSTWE